jgi:hypothetical protein
MLSNNGEKPRTFNADLSVLPIALRPLAKQKRWIVWKWLFKNDNWTKPPYKADDPDEFATNDDPATWCTYEEAIAAFQAGHADGIGYALTNGDLGAFDLDHCRDPETGDFSDWANELINEAIMLGAYVEVSVSGTGARIIGLSSNKTEKWPRTKFQIGGNGEAIEIYRRSTRYITVSGRQIGDSENLPNIDDLLTRTYEQFAGATTTNGRRESQFDDSVPNIAADDPRLAALDPKWIKAGVEGTDIDGKPLVQGSRSEGVFAFACACFRAKIAEDAIASCLIHWGIGEHIRDQSNVRRALNRIMSRAKEAVRDSAMFQMNERHCVLPVGGKTRVVTWGDDPKFPGRVTIIRASSLGDFRALMDKYRHAYQTEQGINTVRLGTWWVNHPDRRQYDGGMRFVPLRDEDVVAGGVLNLWQGFAVAARKPAGGSGASGCQKFLDHGLKIICSGNKEHFDYLIKREAFIAQNRTRSEVALALRTETEGTGKGFWTRGINHLYGQHAMSVQNSDHVIGKHNPHLEKLLRLTADEALFAGDPRHRNALYNLITEPHLTIEPKFVDVYTADNYLNIDILSNAAHFIPVSGSARRFFVPTVSSELAGDHEYFDEILAQLHDGGYEALLYHLLYEIDLRDFNVRDVPKTAALREQAAYSRKGVDLLVEQACNEAVVPCQDGTGFSSSPDYGDRQMGFDRFIDQHPDQELRRLGSLRVKRQLAKDWGCQTGDAARKKRGRGITWPTLKELRETFEAKYGPQGWLRPEEEEWTL